MMNNEIQRVSDTRETRTKITESCCRFYVTATIGRNSSMITAIQSESIQFIGDKFVQVFAQFLIGQTKK